MFRKGTALLVVAAAGILAPASQSARPALTVDVDGSTSLTFAYPSQWHSLSANFVTSHYSEIAFVSSQPLHKPCLEAPAPCNVEAIDRLGPGEVYAKWLRVGWLGLRPRPAAAKDVSVGGRLGWMAVEAGGRCSKYGPSRTLDLVLPATGNSGALEFVACMRAPGVAANWRVVDQVLRSTRFVSPQPGA